MKYEILSVFTSPSRISVLLKGQCRRELGIAKLKNSTNILRQSKYLQYIRKNRNREKNY